MNFYMNINLIFTEQLILWSTYLFQRLPSVVEKCSFSVTLGTEDSLNRTPLNWLSHYYDVIKCYCHVLWNVPIHKNNWKKIITTTVQEAISLRKRKTNIRGGTKIVRKFKKLGKDGTRPKVNRNSSISLKQVKKQPKLL